MTNTPFIIYDESMLIYDTLSGKKKRLPRGKLKMFVCGPTVYNHTHIGHARTYIVFDTIARWLKKRGDSLFYLQNITDIDDKIPDLKTARCFEKEYLNDMKTLNVTSVDKYARASAHLPEIKRQIKVLLDKGFAYKIKSGIYFEVKKFPRYGRLSKQNLDQLRPGWRIELDSQKKDPLDFALWKFPGKYPSPWGKGRPGWHIEDTAITEKHFGPQYDLHGAAVDLKFPHHESEIAQEEAASGKRPMVKIWMHAGFLLVNGEKMSKSLNNFITIKDFLKKYPPPAFRLLVLSHHYRSPIDYTNKLAEQQRRSLQKIEKFMRTIGSSAVVPFQLKNKSARQFVRAMDDDFNTPQALAVLFRFMAEAPKCSAAKRFVASRLKTLGIIVKPPAIPVKIKRLIRQREKLRAVKKFTAADKIRIKIKMAGFLVED